MRQVFYPPPADWPALCLRPKSTDEELTATVQTIMDEVKRAGDTALRAYTEKFNKVQLDNLRVSTEEFNEAEQHVSSELKAAIAIAAQNIRKFHETQLQAETPVNTLAGVRCWRKSVAIDRVGLYIPGGTAPLFSTVLMLVIPALVAGCPQIFLCSPCDANGKVHAAILYTACYLGIDEIYKVGGAQAIAAMCFGTTSIPKADKIFGPGNTYVTKAKELALQAGIAIDLPAGPSEVLVIADRTADPDFVAADLLAQAEHGADSQVVLLTNEPSLSEAVNKAIERQLPALGRKKIIQQALAHSISVVCASLEECIAFSNTYAPEHLIMATSDADILLDKVTNAGSVFVGHYSPESAGDYASGTNHTLPTNGYAKSYSGVSVDSFVKKISFQKISPEGLNQLGPTIETMAEAEGLAAHKHAVRIRLNKLKYEQ